MDDRMRWMRENNTDTLRQTMQICTQGFYQRADGRQVNLQLKEKQMKKCLVYLPDQIRAMEYPEFGAGKKHGAQIRCVNEDSFVVAKERYMDERHRILVLNMANPVHPGGGVRNGAIAQEEELCRRSSLLCALEGEEAAPYYVFNQAKYDRMGSDALIVTPYVEVFRAADGKLMEDPFVVSVLTCAAPNLRFGMGEMYQDAYEAMLYERIKGMFKVAANLGYSKLVMGAFGCGAFRNDAQIVAKLFRSVLLSYGRADMAVQDFFASIDFAVLDRSQTQYNYRAFSDTFHQQDQAEHHPAFWQRILGKTEK